MRNTDWIASPRSRREIEEIAAGWRYYFDVDHHWVPNLLGILEHELPHLVPGYNCRVVEDQELGDAMAVTTFSPPEITFRKSVYDGIMDDRGRDRFTAAHELGHFFLHTADHGLHRGAIKQQSHIDNRSMSAEWQADAFAVSFLLPEDHVRMFSSPEELAECCKVSLSAAQIRMRELRLWPKQRILPPTDFLDKFRKR